MGSDWGGGGARVTWMHPRAGPSVSELSTEGCTEPRLANHMVRVVTASRGVFNLPLQRAIAICDVNFTPIHPPFPLSHRYTGQKLWWSQLIAFFPIILRSFDHFKIILRSHHSLVMAAFLAEPRWSLRILLNPAINNDQSWYMRLHSVHDLCWIDLCQWFVKCRNHTENLLEM